MNTVLSPPPIHPNQFLKICDKIYQIINVEWKLQKLISGFVKANVKARRNKRTDDSIYIFIKVPLKFELQCKKAVYLFIFNYRFWLISILLNKVNFFANFIISYQDLHCLLYTKVSLDLISITGTLYMKKLIMHHFIKN